jgi:hypothetical protein
MTFVSCEFLSGHTQHLASAETGFILHVVICAEGVAHLAQTFNRIASAEIRFMKDLGFGSKLSH